MGQKYRQNFYTNGRWSRRGATGFISHNANLVLKGMYSYADKKNKALIKDLADALDSHMQDYTDMMPIWTHNLVDSMNAVILEGPDLAAQRHAEPTAYKHQYWHGDIIDGEIERERMLTEIQADAPDSGVTAVMYVAVPYAGAIDKVGTIKRHTHIGVMRALQARFVSDMAAAGAASLQSSNVNDSFVTDVVVKVGS